MLASLGQEHRSALWMIQLGVGLAMLAAFVLVVPESLIDWAFVAIGLFGTASVLVGLRVWQPRYRAAWYLLALGVVAYLIGDVIFAVQTLRTGSEPAVPSLADPFFYLLYPLLGASVFLTIRRHLPGRDRAAAVDAALVTVAAAVLSWTYLMAPYASDRSLPIAEKLTSIGYPLGDVLLVALLARLLMVPGRKVPTFYLLVAALVMNLVADVLYGYQTLAGTYESGSLTDVGWLLAYILFGTAALHPSMRRYGRRAEPAQAADSQGRLLVMALAALTAPALILVRVIQGDTSEIGVIAAGCMLMFALVLLRMSGLLDALKSHSEQLQTAFTELQQAQSERQLLLDRTVRAREQERTTLAANLHDGPIQRLAAVSFTLDRAVLRLDRGDHVVAADLLDRGQSQLQAEVDALRRMMSELRPPILDEVGFEAGVHDLVADFARQARVSGSVVGSLLVPLDPEVETALYRVVQEALWNVAKHARATAVEVRLADLDDTVELTVADDGRGFCPAPAQALLREGHFGLVGMRERLESAGGELVIDSGPRIGTRLTARVPRTVGAGAETTFLEEAA